MKIQQYYRIYFVFFLTLMRCNKRDKFRVIPCQDMLDVEHGEISGLMRIAGEKTHNRFWTA